jgi:hypothetical protein
MLSRTCVLARRSSKLPLYSISNRFFSGLCCCDQILFTSNQISNFILNVLSTRQCSIYFWMAINVFIFIHLKYYDIILNDGNKLSYQWSPIVVQNIISNSKRLKEGSYELIVLYDRWKIKTISLKLFLFGMSDHRKGWHFIIWKNTEIFMEI